MTSALARWISLSTSRPLRICYGIGCATIRRWINIKILVPWRKTVHMHARSRLFVCFVCACVYECVCARAARVYLCARMRAHVRTCECVRARALVLLVRCRAAALSLCHSAALSLCRSAVAQSATSALFSARLLGSGVDFAGSPLWNVEE